MCSSQKRIFYKSHIEEFWCLALKVAKNHCNTQGSLQISSVMHTFWLVLTYDPLEDRRIDDVIIKTFFNSLLYKTNRFQVAVRLFSNRSQMTSKCGKNKQVAHKVQLSVSLMFLPHFWHPLWSITEQTCATLLFFSHLDVICDLLLNRCTPPWNLFVKHNRG